MAAVVCCPLMSRPARVHLSPAEVAEPAPERLGDWAHWAWDTRPRLAGRVDPHHHVRAVRGDRGVRRLPAAQRVQHERRADALHPGAPDAHAVRPAAAQRAMRVAHIPCRRCAYLCSPGCMRVLRLARAVCAGSCATPLRAQRRMQGPSVDRTHQAARHGGARGLARLQAWCWVGGHAAGARCC